MSLYTYEDFLSVANKSRTLKQFSQYDLDLAKQYPEFGLTLVMLKKEYAKSATPEARRRVNAVAEELRRSYGNYTAGIDGSGYYSEALTPASYKSAYSEEIGRLLSGLSNRPAFSYDPKSDPGYSSYRKQYLREGQRASADTLGQAAAGIPSTAAVTASQQAGDYYRGKLADKLPELSQQAYSRYLSSYDLDISALSALQKQDQADYARRIEQIKYNSDMAALKKEKENEARTMADAILSAGGRPSAELIKLAGYPGEYAEALAVYYSRILAAAAK